MLTEDAIPQSPIENLARRIGIPVPEETHLGLLITLVLKLELQIYRYSLLDLAMISQRVFVKGKVARKQQLRL